MTLRNIINPVSLLNEFILSCPDKNSDFHIRRIKLSDFKKIKRATNLYEDVVNEINKAILSGKYKTGEALPSETELARQFGVSRPVIRESIKAC